MVLEDGWSNWDDSGLASSSAWMNHRRLQTLKIFIVRSNTQFFYSVVFCFEFSPPEAVECCEASSKGAPSGPIMPLPDVSIPSTLLCGGCDRPGGGRVP